MENVVVDIGEQSRRRTYRVTAAWSKNFLFYIALAVIPLVLFALMMLAAHRR
jgi:hypothetical protein